MSEPLGVLFLILFVIAVAACIYLSITMSRRVQAGITRWRDEEAAQYKQFADEDARQQLERWKVEWEGEIRRDAILRSGVVTKGMATQHIVPYLPGFDLDPKDIRFLGSPVDLIAFKGLKIYPGSIPSRSSARSTRMKAVRVPAVHLHLK